MPSKTPECFMYEKLITSAGEEVLVYIYMRKFPAAVRTE